MPCLVTTGGVVTRRDLNLGKAFRQATVPMLSLLLMFPPSRLWLIEIGGQSDTQPHSCSGASGPQIVIKLTVKIFCVRWEALMRGTWRDSGAVICSSGRGSELLPWAPGDAIIQSGEHCLPQPGPGPDTPSNRPAARQICKMEQLKLTRAVWTDFSPSSSASSANPFPGIVFISGQDSVDRTQMAGSKLCALHPETQVSVMLATCLHRLDVPLLASPKSKLWGLPCDFRGWAAITSHTPVPYPTPGGGVCFEAPVNCTPWSHAGSAPILSPQDRKEGSFLRLVLMFWLFCVWCSVRMRWKKERLFSSADGKGPFHCLLPSDLIYGHRIAAPLVKGVTFVWAERPGAERTGKREESSRGSGQHSDVAS